MKKLMFLLAAASLSSVAFAQQKSNSQNVLVGESVDVMEVPVDKYKVETNHFFDNWFFSVGGGAQVLFGDQSDLGKFKKRIAPALQISIGKWFTPGLGLRLQYSGLQSKSFSSEPSAYSKPHMLSEGYYQDKFNYMNLHGDILFNVSNMIAGYNEDRIYDFVPFVGFGFAHSYDAPRRNSLAFNFGIINTFHLASAWDLNLELYGMGTENKFDGKTTSKGPDFMAGATVGITYKFPQPHIAAFQFDFLDPGKKYMATVYADAADTDYENNQQAYTIRKMVVTNKSKFKQSVSIGSGFAISLFEITDNKKK